jgi:hypothetical protein
VKSEAVDGKFVLYHGVSPQVAVVHQCECGVHRPVMEVLKMRIANRGN